MKSFLKGLGLAVFAVFSAFFFSCDVGLGETVDVMAPIVSITYPPASSIIREKFCLYGSWTDDKGVMLVQVSVKNTDTGKTVYSGNASVGAGTWNITLNNPDSEGKYPFPDGKYTIDVIAWDTSKRFSSTSSRAFEIDNTPPLFVIKNPGSNDLTAPSSYGSIFKMNGSIAEDHVVKTLKVTVYDPDSTDADGNPSKIAEWSESNVNTAGGTSVTFARYDESKNDDLHKNYAEVYTKPDSTGNQKYYCSVLLSDNAGIYRTPGSDTSDSELGNTTTALWLNDSIYGTDAGENDLLSKNAAYQYEIGDLLKIINGTYTGSGDSVKALSVLEATKIDTTTNGNRLAFRLNKDASPTYNFLGYSFTDSAAGNKAAAGNTITFKAECGRNETQFKPKTIKMYLVGPFVPVNNVYPITDAILNSVYGDVETYLENKTEGTDYHVIYNGAEEYQGVSVSSWTETVKLPDDIQTGSYYLLAATGTDMDSIEFTPNDGARYGFAGVSQGIPPSFDLSDETKANVAVDHKNLDFLTLSGKVSSSDSDIRAVSYVITVTDLENQSKLVGTITGNLTQNYGIVSGTLSSNRTIEFNVNAADLQNSSYSAGEDYTSVDARNVSALSGIRYKYEIELIGEDTTGTQGTVNISCVLDKIAPVVSVSAVTPYVAASESGQKDRLNGIVTVTMKVTETNLKSFDVTVSCDDANVTELTDLLETKVTQGTNAESTLLAKFDTAHFADGTNVKINVTATDNAGNTTLIVNDDYIADQTSDLPVITVQNGAIRTDKTAYFKADGTTIDTYTDSNGNEVSLKDSNMFTDSGMLVSVTDDDGIDSAWVEYRKASETSASFTTLGSVQKGKGKTSLTFTSDVHKLATGEYVFRVIAKDVKGEISVKGVKQTPAAVTNYVPSADGYFIVVVDKDIPKISVEGSGDYKSETQDITVDGKISDSTGSVKIIKAANSDGTSGVEEVASVTSCVDQKSWSFDTTTGTTTSSIYFVATDKYGRTSFVEYIYVIDKDKPTVYPGWTDADENSSVETYESGATFHKNNTFTFKIPISDEWINNAHNPNVSGIASVTLKIKNTDASRNETESEAVMSRAEAKSYTYSGTTYPSIFYYYAVTHTFSDGTNKVWITALDKAGNELEYKNNDPYTFNVDVQSPVLTASPATVNDYVQSKPTFTGTATDGNFKELKVTYKRTYAEYDSTTKKVKNTASDGNVTVPVAADGSWTWTVPGDGNYANLKFTAYDEANNYTTSDVYNFTVDVTNIKLLSVAGTADWKNSATQTLKVLAGDWGSAGTAYSSGIEEVAFTRANPDSTNASGKLTQGGLRGSTGGSLIYYEYNSPFTDLAEGQTTFTVTAKDAAGRTEDSPLSVSYNIDTKAPTVTAGIGSIGTTEFKRVKTDTAASYEIKLAANDTNGTRSVSGLKEVSVKKNNTAIKLYTSSDVSEEGANSITLNDAATALTKIESSSPVSFWIKASDIAQGINEFTVNVTDHAGNTGSTTVTFYYDSTLPKVEYTSHAAGATVNKTITLSGTVSEEKTVYVAAGNANNSGIDKSAVKVQWSTNGSDWTDLTSDTDYTAVNFTNSDTAWEITGLDTTKLNATATKADRYVRLLVVDNYGNSNTNSIKLDVDQNSDRPVIELTTITAMNDVIPLRKVSGTISDDDGDLNSLKMWIIESGSWTDTTKVPTASEANGWTSVDVKASGTWSADAAENAHSWLFYVIDKNGGTFWTQSASGDSLLKVPYITYGTTTKADNTSALAFKVDTQAPQITMYISNQELAADDSAETDSSKKWKSAGTVFGGTENKLYIKLEVVEQNMKPATGTVYALPSLKIGTKDVSSSVDLLEPITVDSENNKYTYLLKPITLDKTTYGSFEGSVTVKAALADLSEQEGQGGTNIILDYSAPQVGILSPTATISDAVNAEVTVKGIVTDSYSSIKKMEYVIPLKNATYSVSAGDWASVNVSSASWEIEFPSGSAETSDSLLYYAVNNTQYDGVEDISGNLGIYKVPMYFRVTDSVGNIAVDTNNFVYVDPDGAKPKAWINSPETGTVTNGIVTVFGGASDNISVSKVCIQVDVNGDGEIDSSDRDLLVASDEALCKSIFGAAATIKEASADSNWYILAEGTNSWKCAIDTTTGFATMQSTVTKNGFTLNKDSKYLIVQVRAIDNDGNTRAWTAPNYIQLDSSAPWFTDIALVQFGSGNAASYEESERITQQDYISGQYLSNVTATANGKWYLAVTVEANSTITSVTASAETSTTVNILPLAEDGTTVFVADSAAANYASKDNEKKYRLLIPLKTSESGMISATLNAVNSANGTGTQSIKINIDSTAPSLYTTSGAQTYAAEGNLRIKSNGSSKNLGTNLDTNSVIENSDGYFNLGDKVMESGSGLDLVAFFFNKNGYIYDSMINAGNGTYETFYISSSAGSGSLYINDDHLPAYSLSGVSRPSSDSFAVSSSIMTESAYKHVRKGGLVKIAGIYHKIKEVSDYSSTITVTFAPSVSTTFDDVEIIFAQIVDNMGDETFDSAYTSDYEKYRLLKNDDGDGMCETISQTSSVYTWNAYVNSNNIIDGNISLNIVAMDKAGNISYGNVVSVVANNRPRITKVFLGTDLNGSGKYDFDADEAPVIETGKKGTADGISYGEFNYYSAYNRQNGNAVTAKVLASSAFKVISGLCIVPEFIGGNGSLKYNITTVPDLSASGILAPNSSGSLKSMISRSSLNINNKGTLPLFGNTAISGDGDNENAVAYDVTDNSKVSKVYAEDGTTVINTYGSVSYSDFGGIELDSNDDLISGEGQKNLKITFWDETDSKQDSFGSQWATLVVPFTNMTGETNKPAPKIAPFHWNSSTDNSVYISGATAGHVEFEGSILTDTNYTSGLPKVSGKVKIEGYVYDDVRLASISMSVFGGSSTVVGNYSTGTWSQASSLPTGVVSFEAEDLDMSQKGHSVKYSVVIDTEKLSGVVGTGKVIKISAKDWKGNVSESSSAQTSVETAVWGNVSSVLDKVYYTDNSCTVQTTSKTSSTATVYTPTTAYYAMDVVPYVTEIWTGLSNTKTSAPSMYSRASTGEYVVRNGEAISVFGWNLNNSPSVKLGSYSISTSSVGTASSIISTYTDESAKPVLASLGGATSGIKFTVPDVTSGALSITVQNIPVLNNINDNDVHGNAAADTANYAGYYNRRPNGQNNNTLTDDLALDVWNFKQPITPVGAAANYVHMKVAPADAATTVAGRIGFSFRNGAGVWNMPGYMYGESTLYSHTKIGENYQGFTYNTFTWNKNGKPYGAALCSDTSGNDTQSANFQFFSEGFGMN